MFNVSISNGNMKCRATVANADIGSLKSLHTLLTLVLPILFCNMVYQGGGYHPLMNLKLTGPKYDCLVPWYRVRSSLSIDTTIMKINQRMTSQWRFQTWPDSKSGFLVKIDQNWKKKSFFSAKKDLNIGISPGVLLIKKENSVVNMSWKF